MRLVYGLVVVLYTTRDAVEHEICLKCLRPAILAKTRVLQSSRVESRRVASVAFVQINTGATGRRAGKQSNNPLKNCVRTVSTHTLDA